MIEVIQNIGPDILIYMVQTTDGPRPLRWEGRDFIKVLYTSPNGELIYQCFYKSTGLHTVKGSDTQGMWTPCDGIVIEDKGFYIEELASGEEISEQMTNNYVNKWKTSSAVVTKVDYLGRQLAADNWALPSDGEDYRSLSWYNSCHPNNNNNAIICRFGNCTLARISYLLSNNDNVFWNTEEGEYMKTLCNLKNVEPYAPNIPFGIATDALSIDIFIDSALSMNHTDIDQYVYLRNTYGIFDLRDCIVKHPSIGKSIVASMVKAHCKSPKGEILKGIYISINSSPLKTSMNHMAEEVLNLNKFVENMDTEENMDEVVENMDTEETVLLPPNFNDKNCRSYPKEILHNIAMDLGVNILNINGGKVDRRILCIRIMKELMKNME